MLVRIGGALLVSLMSIVHLTSTNAPTLDTKASAAVSSTLASQYAQLVVMSIQNAQRQGMRLTINTMPEATTDEYKAPSGWESYEQTTSSPMLSTAQTVRHIKATQYEAVNTGQYVALAGMRVAQLNKAKNIRWIGPYASRSGTSTWWLATLLHSLLDAPCQNSCTLTHPSAASWHVELGSWYKADIVENNAQISSMTIKEGTWTQRVKLTYGQAALGDITGQSLNLESVADWAVPTSWAEIGQTSARLKIGTNDINKALNALVAKLNGRTKAWMGKSSKRATLWVLDANNIKTGIRIWAYYDAANATKHIWTLKLLKVRVGSVMLTDKSIQAI